jgi:hypothetical protein
MNSDVLIIDPVKPLPSHTCQLCVLAGSIAAALQTIADVVPSALLLSLPRVERYQMPCSIHTRQKRI